MKSKQEVTRAEFVLAVRDFKQKHDGKLKHILNDPKMVEEFLTNSVIHAYLTRPEIIFIDRHPHLQDSITKVEHGNTDHYELKIYKCMPGIIPWRDAKITTPTFYDYGTRFTLTNSLLNQYSDKGGGDIAVILGSGEVKNKQGSDGRVDIFEVAKRTLIRQFEPYKKDEKSPRFLIFNHGKDAHFAAIVCIIEPNNQRVLATLLINSSDDHYYNYLRERYLNELQVLPTKNEYDADWLRDQIKDADKDGDRDVISIDEKRLLSINAKLELERLKTKQDLRDLFSIDLDEPSLLQSSTVLITSPIPDGRHNEEAKAACVIDPNWDGLSGLIEQVRNRKDIDRIYVIHKDHQANTAKVSLYYRPNELFLNASHNLQLEKNDKNCGLYSYNFIQATVEMLKSPEIADKTFALAKASYHGDKEAEQALCHVFQNDLKAYLPCYYAESGQRKSFDEVADFHLKQRWRMGGLLLSILYPPVKPIMTSEIRENATESKFDKHGPKKLIQAQLAIKEDIKELKESDDQTVFKGPG